MKTNAALLILAAVMAGTSYIQVRAQTPAGNAPGTKLSYPYGQECIITLDPRSARSVPVSGKGGGSGFQAGGTLRGSLIYFSDEWCVLKDGLSENWIPRDRVLVMNVSK